MMPTMKTQKIPIFVRMQTWAMHCQGAPVSEEAFETLDEIKDYNTIEVEDDVLDQR